MANLLEDEDYDSQFSRPYYGRQNFSEQSKQYPKAPAALIKQVFKENPQTIIDLVCDLDQESMKEFKKDLENMEIRAQISEEKQMKDDFKIKFFQELQKCYKQIISQQIHISDEKLCKFNQSLHIIAKNFIKNKFSKEIINQVWEKKVKNCEEIYQLLTNLKLLDTFCLGHMFLKEVSNLQDQPLKAITEQLEILRSLENLEKINEQNKFSIRLLKQAKIKDQEELILLQIRAIMNLKKTSKQSLQENHKSLINKIQKYVKQGTFSKKAFDWLIEASPSCRFFQSILSDSIILSQTDFQNMKYQSKDQSVNSKYIDSKIITKLISKEIYSKFQYLQKNMVKLISDKLFCKFDLHALDHIEQLFNQSPKSKKQTTLFDLRSIIELLMDNLDKPICFIDKKEKQITAFEYLCKIFDVFVRYLILVFRIQYKDEIKTCYTEQFAFKLLDILYTNLIKEENIGSSQCLQTATSFYSYVAYFIFVFQAQQFSQIRNKMVDMCIKLILQIGKVQSEWRCIKYIRLIIEYWALETIPNKTNMSRLINIFFTAFFSHKFIFTKDSYFVFLKNRPPCDEYRKIFSEQCSLKVKDFALNLIGKDLSLQNEKLKYDRQLFKLYLIVIGNFKLTTAEQIAKTIYRIYTSSAHKLPAIYKMRSFISYYYKPSETEEIDQKAKICKQLLNSLKFLSVDPLQPLESLQNEIPQRYSNKKQLDQNMTKFLVQAQSLTNLLQVKSECQNLSKQCYQIIIHGIINKISDQIGVIYHNILDQMKKPDVSKIIQKNLVRNFFREKKSIYERIHLAMFHLKNVIRLYICNVPIMTSYPQLHFISEEIGKLLKGIFELTERKQRTRLQLTNQLLSNIIFKKRSHLIYKQALTQSNAYKGSLLPQLRQQSLMRRSEASLNIVIPIFSIIKQELPKFLAVLTQHGRETFEGRFRFNHHIAFEQQLRKIIIRADIFDIVVKNTLITHSQTLIENIYLPKINNKTDQLQKIGLSFYLEQFQIIFNSPQCSNYVQDHIKTFIKIYKYKNRSQRNNIFLERSGNVAIKEPHDFEKYGIQPMQYNQFKEKARKILQTYLTVLPQKIFQINSTKLDLYQIFQFIKEFNVNNQGQKLQQQEKNRINYTMDKFLATLIEKIPEKLNKYRQQKKKNLQQEVKQQESPMKKHQKTPKRKKKSLPNTPTLIIFKILSFIDSKNEKLVKLTFEKRIQFLLLDYIFETKEIAQINQVLHFIIETLPKVHENMSKGQKDALVSYYVKILYCLKKFRNRGIYQIQRLFVKMINFCQKFRSIGQEKQANQFHEKITTAVLQSVAEQKSMPKIQDVISRLMSVNDNLMEHTIQMEVKSYIFQTYEKRLREKQFGKQQKKGFQNAEYIQIDVFDYLKSLEGLINQNEKIFTKITNKLFSGHTQNGHYLIYEKGLNSLKYFEAEDSLKPFYQFELPKTCEYILKKMISLLTQQIIVQIQQPKKQQKQDNKVSQIKMEQETEEISQQQKKKKQEQKKNKQEKKKQETQQRRKRKIQSILNKRFSIVQQLLTKFRVLIPYAFQLDVQSQHKDLLEWTISKFLQKCQMNYVDFLSLALNKNSLYLKDFDFMFCHYVSARIIQKCINFLSADRNIKQQNSKKILFMIECCLSIKEFNNMCQLRVTQKQNQKNLLGQIQSILLTNQQNDKIHQNKGQTVSKLPPIHTLLCDMLYLIYQHRNVQKFELKNKLFEIEEDQVQMLYRKKKYRGKSARDFLHPQIFISRLRSEGLRSPRMSVDVINTKKLFKQYKTDVFKMFMESKEFNLKGLFIEKIISVFQSKFKISQDTLQLQRIYSSLEQQQSSLTQASIDKLSLLLSELYQVRFQKYELSQKNKKRNFRRHYFSQRQQTSKVVSLSETRFYPFFRNMKKIVINQKQNKLIPRGMMRTRSPDGQSSDWDFDNDEEQEIATANLRQRVLQQQQSRQNRQQYRRQRFNQDEQTTIIPASQFIQVLDMNKIQSLKDLSPKKFSQKQTSTEEKMIEKDLTESQEMEQKKQIIKYQNISQGNVDEMLQNFGISEADLKELQISKVQLQNMDQATLQDTIQGIFQNKNKQKKQENPQTKKEGQTLKKTENYLLENKNYQLLQSKKNFWERCQFLMNANQTFFTELPIQIRDEIIRQRNMLRRDNTRANEYKDIMQRIHQQNLGIEQHIRRPRKKKAKRRIKTIEKFKKLNEQQEIQLPEKIIIQLLKELLILVNGVNNYKSLRLLMQLSSNRIKHKTMTTILVFLKNYKKIGVKYGLFDDKAKSWKYMAEFPKQINQLYEKKLLDYIFCSFENNMFENDQLLVSECGYDCYKQILTGLTDQDIKQSFDPKLGATETSYLPINQIFYLSLEMFSDISPYLVNKLDKFTPKIIEKIFQKMKKQEVPDQFYDNLQKIQNNEYLIQLFEKTYSKNQPPSYNLLGNIMKFKFGQFGFIKQIHLKALQRYAPENNAFIRQVFALYTLEELQQMKETLLKYKEIHFKAIQELFEEGSKLQDSPIKILVQIKDLLDFKTKKMIFLKNQAVEGNRRNQSMFQDRYISLDIDTVDLLRSSYNSIMSLVPQELNKPIDVKYIGQSGFGSGMFKQWLSLLSDKIFSPELGLFVPIGNLDKFQPNPYSYLNPEHLSYFKFLGRLLGIAILQNHFFPVFFTSFFYKMLLGKKAHWTDLLQLNQKLYWEVRGFLNDTDGQGKKMDYSLLQNTFTYVALDIEGKQVEKQLKPGGKDIKVTQENKNQFIQLATKEVYGECIQQYEMIKEGFNQIVPLHTLNIFTSRDVQLLISGIPDVNVQQMKKYVKYRQCDESVQVVKWFWQVLEESSKQQVCFILRFITGSPRVGAGGFAKFPIQIRKYTDNNRLPSSHTCFSALDLPEYESKQILKKNFERVLYWSKDGQALEE